MEATRSDHPPPAAAPAEKGSSLWHDAWLRLRKNRMAMAGMIYFACVTLACFAGPWLAGLPDPNTLNLDARLQGSSAAHWLGTDHLGRDLLARILDGGQISLLVGIITTTLVVAIGVVVGGVSGYAPRALDAAIMRSVDVLYALPFLVVAILFSLWANTRVEALTGWLVEHSGADRNRVFRLTSLVPVFVAIGALGWLTMARIVRAQVLTLRHREFVEAARSLGLGHFRILFLHILPNTLGPVIVYATLTVPAIMLFEAVLSFLSLGVQPPNSSWGILIKEGADRMDVSPALLAWPALVFSTTLLALNFLGDGLRDALDPKSSKD
jgi:oligopeptide transport system permease protein